MFHNVFCLESEKEKYKSSKIAHSTLKEACDTAIEILAKNIIMSHTEMDSLDIRKQNYTKEAKRYFQGNAYIPNDLEEIQL